MRSIHLITSHHHFSQTLFIRFAAIPSLESAFTITVTSIHMSIRHPWQDKTLVPRHFCLPFDIHFHSSLFHSSSILYHFDLA